MKVEIDRYFNDNYKKIVSIAQKKVSYYRAECDAEGLVAEAYLYFLNKPPKDTISIPKLVTTYLQIECSMYNSINRRAYRQRHHSVELDSIRKTSNNVDELMTWHDLNKEILIFKATMSADERIIVDLYLFKGIKSATDLSKHFNIPIRSFARHYGQLMKKIRKYENSKRRV